MYYYDIFVIFHDQFRESTEHNNNTPGNWEVIIHDEYSGDDGILDYATLTLYTHKNTHIKKHTKKSQNTHKHREKITQYLKFSRLTEIALIGFCFLGDSTCTISVVLSAVES